MKTAVFAFVAFAVTTAFGADSHDQLLKRSDYDPTAPLDVHAAVAKTGAVSVMIDGLVAAQPVQPPQAARTADVNSQDAIIAALYDVISGPGGQKRNWDRFRSLFAPGARLIPTGRKPDGSGTMRVLTPDEYAGQIGPRLEESGFFEREIARTSEEFGSIVQAFSTYESRHAAGDAQPFARGINSIQLVNDGTRWWVMTVLWDAERPDNPIPAKYLKKNGS